MSEYTQGPWSASHYDVFGGGSVICHMAYKKGMPDVANAQVQPTAKRSEAGRLEPLVGRLRRLADCDARAGEPLGICMREAATEIEELRAQVRSLQSALSFWLPGVPAENSPCQNVIADHAWLLAGFDAGPQASAEELGWIALTPNAKLISAAPDLLAALQIAAEALCDLPLMDPRVVAIRAAIAKATA